jgi:hypothetical protein
MIAAYLRSMARRFLWRACTEREMEEELESHVQLRADALERGGLDRAEAERRARIEFGGHVRFKEECREAMGGNAIDQAIQDVRFSLRALRKSPAFSLVAVITLALGIGATVATFSVVNTVLLRPFAFSHPEKLIWIYSQRSDNPAPIFRCPSIAIIVTRPLLLRAWSVSQVSTRALPTRVRPNASRECECPRAYSPCSGCGRFSDAL